MIHIRLDEILAYIDQSIDNSLKRNIEDHLEKCDKCFAEYTIYKTSYNEIEKNKLPVPSQDLINTIEKKLLINNTEKSSLYKYIEYIPNYFNSILSNPIFAPVIGTTIIFLIIFNIKDSSDISSGELSPMNSRERSPIIVEKIIPDVNQLKYNVNFNLADSKSESMDTLKQDILLSESNTKIEEIESSLDDLLEEKLVSIESDNIIADYNQLVRFYESVSEPVTLKSKRSSAFSMDKGGPSLSTTSSRKRVKIPNLKNLDPKNIEDTLRVLNIRYRIIYNKKVFLQYPKYEDKDTLRENLIIIYYPGPKP